MRSFKRTKLSPFLGLLLALVLTLGLAFVAQPETVAGQAYSPLAAGSDPSDPDFG
jgi:hypothetical protein